MRRAVVDGHGGEPRTVRADDEIGREAARGVEAQSRARVPLFRVVTGRRPAVRDRTSAKQTWLDATEAVAKTVGHAQQTVELVVADSEAAHLARSGLCSNLFRVGIALRSHYEAKRGVILCWGEAIPDAEFVERVKRRRNR